MSVLTDKYPALTSPSKRLFFSLIMSGFVFIFLSIFQPFGLSNEDGMVMICAGFGVTCLVVMLILNLLIIPMLPGFFNEHNWLVWKEIVWVIINVSAIGFANSLYAAWVMEVAFTLQLVGTFQFYTVAVSLLPIVLSVLTNYNRLRNKYERDSVSLSNEMEKHPHTEKKAVHSFAITNGNESIALNSDTFLYAKSSDNYVEVVYYENNSLKRDVIRKTLKSTAMELADIPDIFQVHRSYLVNLNQVNHFSGNAQGLKLHFEQTDTLVPVSRNLTESLKSQLATRH